MTVKKRRHTRMQPSPEKCGTHANYTYGCRCDECRHAHAAYRRKLAAKWYLSRVDRLHIDATGTRRRIRSLQAIGYTNEHLGQHLGQSAKYTYELCTQARVHIDTARRIAALYDELSMTIGPSKTTMARAKRKGWAPPLAWDDATIDDPNAAPDLGAPADGTSWLDDATELLDAGCSWDEIAARLGLKPHSLESKCRRAGRTDLLERIRKAAA